MHRATLVDDQQLKNFPRFIWGLILCFCNLAISGCQQESHISVQKTKSIARSEQQGSVAAFYKVLVDALDANDDWQTLYRLAQAAEKSHPQPPAHLASAITLAYWVSGNPEDAQRVATVIPLDSQRTSTLTDLMVIHWAKGELKQAQQLGERQLKMICSYFHQCELIAGVFLESGQLEKLPDAYLQAAFIADESLRAREFGKIGEAELRNRRELYTAKWSYYKQLGKDPLNIIKQFGKADIYKGQPLQLECMAQLNGSGPHRLKIDTGSHNLILAAEVADELSLRPLAEDTLYSSLEQRKLHLTELLDTLTIGDFQISRIPVATVPWSREVENGCVGYIGTDVLYRGRLMVDFKHGKIQLKASSNDCASGIQQPFLLLRSQYIVFPAQLNGLFIQVMLDTGFSQYEGLSKERNLEELTQSYYLADHSKTEEYEKFLDEEEKITNASDDEVFPSKRFRSRIWLSRTRFEQLFDAQDTYTFEKKTVAFGRSAVRTEQVSPGVLFEFVGRQFKRTRCHEYPALDKSISLSVGMRVDAIVGMNTLATAKRVTIDFPRRVLWIEW